MHAGAWRKFPFWVGSREEGHSSTAELETVNRPSILGFRRENRAID